MSRRYSPLVVLASLTLVSSACSVGSSNGGSGHAVRDSAGIRIVENYSPSWSEGEEWRIGPEPAVSIGVAEGEPEYQLFQVSDATRLEDGRIAIVNSGTKEVRVFDPGGLYVETVGGEGDGPGEFRYPFKIARAALDTVRVFDGAYPGSVSLFDNTAFIERTTLDRAGLEAAFPGWFAEGGDLLPDGTLLLGLHNQANAGPSPAGAFRIENGWTRMTADGSRIDTVGFFPGYENFGYESEGRMTGNALPFGANTFVVAGGNPVRVFVADSRVYEIRGLSDDGALRTLIRRDYPPRQVTADDISGWEAQYHGFLDQVPEAQRGRFLEYLDVVEYPDTKPVLGILKVDLEGNLWVGDTDRAGDGQSMSVFSPEGVWRGHVTLPPTLRIFEVGPDYVLGSTRDELGIETVALHELAK